MNELSLFSGAGGGVLGTMLAGHTPIGYVEWDAYCQQVIAARIRDGIYPEAPIFTDVREFVQSGAAKQYRGFADLVTAGFPCQPFSVAGKQAGADDERNMWPATAEVIRAVRPKTFFGENVPGLISSGYFGIILRDLAEMGYTVKWGVMGASDVGANHRRKRLWILAESEICRRDRRCPKESRENRCLPCSWAPVTPKRSGASPALVADADSHYAQRQFSCNPNKEGWTKQGGRQTGSQDHGNDWWESEPRLDRMAHGVANRANRLKAIGNGQVSAVACRALEVLNA